MLKLKVINNLKRTEVIVDENRKIGDVCEENGISLDRGVTNLNGMALTYEDMGKSFAELGVGDTAFIANVVKADNA